VYRIFDSAWTQRTDGVSGRISRAKYWLAAVIYIAVMVVLGGLAYELDIAEEMPAISIVLAVIIPVVISGIFTYAALVGAAMCSAFKCGTLGRWP
jgi:uncharacterized membrane protein YhaH (DUF805 family)